ncbi:hypothetical protein Tco_0577880, partial [Tanacetum coccineum]
CEEYALEFLGFPNSSGGNPTPTSEPFTSEFILEEIEACLKDDSISPEIDHADCDPEEDICMIEKLLNNDPFQLPPMDLKQKENDKLPVIIAKGLKNDEKDALLKVLKSHKRAIAWKITDIKGIDPRFCTHKILMEDDYKPTIQSQRRVNPKIHECTGIKLIDISKLVTHRLDTDITLQSRSGQVEVSNRGLKRILERTVGEKKTYLMRVITRKLQLNELNELRDQAYENSLIYKERTKKLHDSKIKNRIFNVGDRVLLFNSHLKDIIREA